MLLIRIKMCYLKPPVSIPFFREKLEKVWKEKMEQQREELEQQFQRERELLAEQKLKEVEDAK
jgi:hypothetical protein